LYIRDTGSTSATPTPAHRDDRFSLHRFRRMPERAENIHDRLARLEPAERAGGLAYFLEDQRNAAVHPVARRHRYRYSLSAFGDPQNDELSGSRPSCNVGSENFYSLYIIRHDFFFQ
jgi:hypothetical protein